MKKSNLWWGLAFTALGLFLLGMAVTDTWESSLVWGCGGGALGSGLMTVVKYVYWTAPERAEEYRERLEEEQIQLRDELLERLRDKAGRITYVLGLAVLCLGILALSVLEELGVLREIRLTVLCLGGYFFFQLIMGVVVFRILKKRY